MRAVRAEQSYCSAEEVTSDPSPPVFLTTLNQTIAARREGAAESAAKNKVLPPAVGEIDVQPTRELPEPRTRIGLVGRAQLL
jgi:hypothetical protein